MLLMSYTLSRISELAACGRMKIYTKVSYIDPGIRIVCLGGRPSSNLRGSVGGGARLDHLSCFVESFGLDSDSLYSQRKVVLSTKLYRGYWKLL